MTLVGPRSPRVSQSSVVREHPTDTCKAMGSTPVWRTQNFFLSKFRERNFIYCHSV